MSFFTILSFLVAIGLLHTQAASIHSFDQTTSHARLRPRLARSVSKNRTSNDAPFWLAEIDHQGFAPFANTSSYPVFRNVKDYGAVGDGIHDDTAAINMAMNSSTRCAPGVCDSSTRTPAIVYIPGGTYLMEGPIVDFYFTQIIGNPNDLPVIKASPKFRSLALIDGDFYQPGTAATGFQGVLGYKAVNVFYRQIRNVILDTTAVPANVSVNCIHWPTAQATSLEKIEFRMSDSPGTMHQGLFIESGSGGFMTDIVSYGGLAGASLGNQQFTSRNLNFYNAVNGIIQTFDWGWTYKSITIKNCSIGLNMSNAGPEAQTVGSITLIDSLISDTKVGILTSHSSQSSTASNGTLVLENVEFNNVTVAIEGPKNEPLLTGTGGSITVAAWGQGHEYTPVGPQSFSGAINSVNRPQSLLNGTKYFEISKPNYNTLSVDHIRSVRSGGAKGDGVTDDTNALQLIIDAAAIDGSVVFFDYGIYKVTKTLYFPRGSKIVGESYPVILSSGKFFANMHAPQPVVRVGVVGEVGNVQWSEMVVGTQGAQAGAILIEWNLAAEGQPSGMWDVHTRIGGFAGSDLQLKDCPANPVPSKSNATLTNKRPNKLTSATGTSSGFPTSSFNKPAHGKFSNATHPRSHNESSTARVNENCIGAFMSMHITKSASGLYMENVWLWTADHDLDAVFTNITVYSGRGLYVESQKGNIWMVGTSSEHHSLYQYQLANTQSLFLGQMQTETAYYQPHPDITQPFPPVESLQDPHASDICKDSNSKKNCDGLGLRIIDSQDISIYGAGLYSFFNDYNTTCSSVGKGGSCQQSIFSIEGANSKGISVYNLNTVGATSMIDRDGQSLAKFSDNIDVFPDSIAVYRSE